MNSIFKNSPMKLTLHILAVTVLCSTLLAQSSNPVPFINQPLVPETVAPGSGGFTLTVHGSGFAPTAVVEWNGSARQTIVVSSSLLQATIKASDVASTSSNRVTVVNLDSHNETSDVTYFMVRKPTPSVALIPSTTFSATGFVAGGDFNNDGRLDIAVCNVNGTTLVVDVYLGEGKLKFNTPIESTFKLKGKVLVITNPVVAGDYNNDHKLDLAVPIRQTNATHGWGIVALLGDGKGKFVLGPISGGRGNSGIVAPGGDINGDGNLDFLTTDFFAEGSSASVNLIQGLGDGSFGSQAAVSFGSGNGAYAPIAGDFNEDGLLDIAVINDSYVVVALNQGHGLFGSPVSYPIPAAGSLITADINGDSHLDIVTDTGVVLLGKGDGTFTNGQRVGAGGIDVAADFNGDGMLDLVAANSLSVLLGNGDGTFQSPFQAGYGFNASQGVALSAFRPDGRLGLVGSGAVLWQVPTELSPPNMRFSQQQVGTRSQPQTATLVNADALPLPITDITIAGTNPKNFSQTNNCPASLPVGGSCQIQVTFAPKSQGDKSASLSVSYTGPGSPQSVALTGTGVGGTRVSLTPANLAFAIRIIDTASDPQTATLTNTGSEDVTMSSISTAAPFSQTNNCPATLPVAQSCQIQVTFQPTAVGAFNGTLSVMDSAPDSPQTVSLSGTGTQIKFSPIGINFGNQKVGTSSNPIPVTLSNKGTVTLNISQIAVGGTNPGDFSQTNNCGSSVPAGGQCTIQVTFTPTQKGQRLANIQLYDDVLPSPQQGPGLGGNGT
jgi:hypothetical protein